MRVRKGPKGGAKSPIQEQAPLGNAPLPGVHIRREGAAARHVSGPKHCSSAQCAAGSVHPTGSSVGAALKTSSRAQSADVLGPWTSSCPGLHTPPASLDCWEVKPPAQHLAPATRGGAKINNVLYSCIPTQERPFRQASRAPSSTARRCARRRGRRRRGLQVCICGRAVFEV